MDNTCSRLVEIKDFASRILGNSRSIYVYLPPSYYTNTDHYYDVLYMHDGQHVFASDETGGSWEMHQSADRLASEGKIKEIIIVGISTVPHQRLNEYFHDNPLMHESFQGPFAGEHYENFIIDEVIPYINKHYRTRTGSQHTAMMGSSAGGIVTYNIGFRRPDVFGMIAVMSPFFYHNEFDVDGRLHEHPFYQRYHTHPEGLRIWLDMGGAEGLFMERYAREEAKFLVADGFVLGQDLMLLLDPGAGHSQLDWAHRVHSPLLFFFGEIGQPASIRLVGEHTIGQKGPDKWMNPVVTYTSGFVRTGLPGVFHVDHPEVLAVLPDGRIKGLAWGSTVVHYTEAGVSASKEMTVVEEVPELVQVTVHVKVPNDTPPYPTIYAGIEVTYKEDGSYSGTAMIPHGLTFTFRISRGFGLHERLGDGSDIIHRSFTTNQNMVLCYEVEAWDQELH